MDERTDKRIRVGIVDDHSVVRAGLRTILGREPTMTVVAEAAEGRAAVEAARAGGIDVMLLDLRLPDMAGLEIARQRYEEGWPLKIVLLTMLCEQEILDRALEWGIGGYVLKESAASDIVRAVSSVHGGGQFFSAELSELMMARYWSAKAVTAPIPGLHRLTEAERRVLRMIASDRTTKEITSDLSISPRTVDTHRANISSKLHLKGNHCLLRYAFENRSELM